MNNPSQPSDYQDLLKRAYLALEKAQAKIKRLEQQKSEPIAVIGMGCRFPGGGNNPEAFWNMLFESVDAIREIPGDRWNIDQYYDPNPERIGMMNTRYGGFLDQIDCFDASFFNMSPREAIALDPQQRMVLETTWEALEYAGILAEQLAGSATGVFLGACVSDYAFLQLSDHELIDVYTGGGTALSIIANRLSYWLDLHGPSVVIDTACSSSLVTVHLAVQSLRNRECDLAFAGGVSAMIVPEPTIATTKSRMMAPDGRCKTFDARANGYVRGEGCGVIILKRLEDAQIAQDPILAVIRGSAVNQDGRTNGLTAPNALSQQDVIRKAQRNAMVNSAEIGYIETHGTGTSLGDPIEVEALAAVFNQSRVAHQHCVLGSVKTNIGHLEAAAGIAGLIKAIQCVRYGRIPAHLHFRSFNPHINFQDTPFILALENTNWPTGYTQRIAGVSSFGFGGTNAHVVVAESPPRPAMHAGGEAAGVEPLVLLLSAHTPQALLARLMHWQQWLPTQSSTALPAILATAATRRTAFAARCALVVPTAAELPAALARATPAALLAPSTPPRLAFIFSGQAPLDPAMLLALRSLPQTAAILDAGAAQLAAAGIDLWAMLTDPLAAQFVRSTDRAQPLLLLLQVALVAWWSALGVTPHAVVGHSVGEFAAAVTAGVLDLATALDLTLARGALLTPLHGQGAMLAVGAAAEQVREVLEQQAWASEVVIAAVNSPRTTVIAGTHAALAAAAAYWRAAGVFTRDVGVEYAFHSPQLDPLLPAWRETVAGIAGGATSCAFYSTVTGTVLGGDALDGGYWEQQLRAPVQFGAAVQAVLEDGIHVLVEIGPGATLQAVLEQGYAAATVSGVCIASLVGQQAPALALRTAAGRLWEAGVAIKWTSIFPDPEPPVALPAYPWQRKRYWLPTQRMSMQRQHQSTSQDSIYVVDWTPLSDVKSFLKPKTEAWLIISDQASAAMQLANNLQHQDCIVHLITNSADYTQILQKYIEQHPLHAVVYIASPYSVGQIDSTTLATQQTHIISNLLSLMHALIQLESKEAARLWIVTHQAQSVGKYDVDPSHAPLWGLSRTFHLEHPQLWGGIIDFDMEPTTVALDQATKTMLTAKLPVEQAWRGEQGYIPQLVRKPFQIQATDSLQLSEKATYLITGGLGGIGLTCAAWLVDCGARFIVLVSRKAPDDVTKQVIQQLQTRGATILTHQVDVSSATAVQQLITQIKNSLPPLRGVFHAAGVIDDGLVINQTWANYAHVFESKVIGGWNLHLATAELSLDHFVLFSSGIALTGAAGQANYAAANAFLDALAYYRHQQNLPALSINWGAWINVGMAARLGEITTRRLEHSGMQGIKPEQAMAILATLLQSNLTQVGVFDIDWNRFVQAAPPLQHSVLLRHLAANSDVALKPSEPQVYQYLMALPSYARAEQLELFVYQHIRQSLRLDTNQVIDADQGLFSLGFDSLTALDLTNRISTELGQLFPVTLIFEYSTPRALITYLFAVLFEVDQTQIEVENTTAEIQELSVQDMSEDDLIALIDQEIVLLQRPSP